MKHDYSAATTSLSKRPRRPIEIVMTPMIDVIFLLLVFFLATSSFQIVEKLLPSGVSEMTPAQGSSPELPEDASDDAVEQVVIKLELRGDGVAATLNGAVLQDLAELQTRLKAVAAARADVPVIIDPVPDVIARDVIRAYDWARMSGLTRVFFATRP